MTFAITLTLLPHLYCMFYSDWENIFLWSARVISFDFKVIVPYMVLSLITYLIHPLFFSWFQDPVPWMWDILLQSSTVPIGEPLPLVKISTQNF